VHRTIQAAARESGYFVSSVNLPDVTREDLAAAVEHLLLVTVPGVDRGDILQIDPGPQPILVTERVDPAFL